MTKRTMAISTASGFTLFILIAQIPGFVAFLTSPRLAEMEKIERRADMTTLLTNCAEVRPISCPPESTLIHTLGLLDIQTWERKGVLLFGRAVRDTFEWYGVYPGMKRAGHHGFIITYRRRERPIVSFAVWSNNELGQQIPLPHAVTMEELIRKYKGE